MELISSEGTGGMLHFVLTVNETINFTFFFPRSLEVTNCGARYVGNFLL